MRKILIIIIALSISYNSKAQSSYKEGYYYNSSGQKISGFIDFQPSTDKIYFKANKDANSEKINIKDINSIVIQYGGVGGNDDFIVLTEGKGANNRYFAKPYFTTPVTHFYYKYVAYFYGGGSTLTQGVSLNPGARGSQPNFTPNFRVTSSPRYHFSGQVIMYQDAGSTFELTKGNYIEVLGKAFADYPDIVKRIQNKEFNFKHLEDIFDKYRRGVNKLRDTAVTIKLDSGG